MTALEDDAGLEIGHATDVNRLDHIPTTLRNLPNKMPRTVTYRKRKSLPAGYKPGEFDVCCGRGKRHWNHIGNVRFRRIIQSNVERYMDAPSKNDKTAVVVSIVDDIRQMNGCFLKEDLRGNWYDIGDQQAREKVGHSLRDQVSTIHRQKAKQQALHQHHAQQIQIHMPPKQTTTPPKAAMATSPKATSLSPTIPVAAISAPPTTTAAPSQQQPPNLQFPAATQPGGPAVINSLSPSPKPASPAAATTTPNNGANTVNFMDNVSPPKNHTTMPTTPTSPSKDNADMLKMSVLSLAADDPVDYGYIEEEDEGALSDGSNERTARRSTLSSSMIIDKFARRPSFASAVADPISNNSLTQSFSTNKSNSKRSSGWSFLNELDFNMEQFDQDFQDGLEPIHVKSQVEQV